MRKLRPKEEMLPPNHATSQKSSQHNNTNIQLSAVPFISVGTALGWIFYFFTFVKLQNTCTHVCFSKLASLYTYIFYVHQVLSSQLLFFHLILKHYMKCIINSVVTVQRHIHITILILLKFQIVSSFYLFYQYLGTAINMLIHLCISEYVSD